MAPRRRTRGGAQRRTVVAGWDGLVLLTFDQANRAGDWKNAAQALEKSLELAPEESAADNGFFLAIAHWQLGEKEKAEQWYRKAAAWMDQHRPTDKELLQFRAEASTLLGLPDSQATGKHGSK